MASPRQCEGQVLGADASGNNGLVIPPFPQQLFGADDQWNFTTAGTGSTHAGIETASMLNRRMAIRRVHFPFGSGPSGGKWAWPTAAMTSWVSLSNPSVIPMVTHGSQGQGTSGFPVKTAGKGYANTSTTSFGQGIDRVTNGEWDAAYTDAFTRMKNAGGPWIFNAFMEMNIPAMGAYGGYQGGTNGPGQKATIAAIKHLWDLIDAAGATNIIKMWCPAFYDPDNNMLSYYPGDRADIVAGDLYRSAYAGSVDTLHDFAKTHGKPFMIAESGFWNTAQGSQPKSVDLMVADWAAQMTTSRYSENVGWILWNFNNDPTGSQDVIDATAAGLKAYQKVASSANFNAFYVPGSKGGGGGGGPIVFQRPALTTDTTIQEVAGTITGSESQTQDYEDEMSVRAFLMDYTLNVKYVGGAFTKVGNAGNASTWVLNSPTTRNHIYAEDATTGALKSWNPNCDAMVWYICDQNPSGKVFFSGEFTHVGGTARSKVALGSDASGSFTLDSTFNPGTINGTVYGLAYDGTYLIITGDFTSVGGTTRLGIARLNATTGALDSWYPTGGLTAAVSYGTWRVQLNYGNIANDTAVYVGGPFDHAGGAARNGVAAFNSTTGAVLSWNPDVVGPVSASGAMCHDLRISPDGQWLACAFAGADSGGSDGNHGIVYRICDADGTVDRQNARFFPAFQANGDGGDHNSCDIDNQYAAFGHHGDGSKGTAATTSTQNHKVYVVDLATGSSTSWIPNPEPNSVQGTYCLRLYKDRFLVGGVYTSPRNGTMQYARAYTGGGGGGGNPSAPALQTAPTLSDTSPVQGEVITPVAGQWTGSPTPTVTDNIQLCATPAAAALTPLYATGVNISGNKLADDSGNGLVGTLIAGSSGTLPTSAAGPLGGDASINFDGTGGRVEIPDDGSLSPKHWTLAAWVKLASPPGDTDPAHQRYEIGEKADAYWINVRYDTSPAYLVRIGSFFGPSKTFANMTAVTPLVPGTWAHVAGTYDGTQMKIYINGSLDASKAQTGDSVSNLEKLCLGAKHRVLTSPAILEAYMNGKVSDFCVFDHALTAGEITTLSALTFPVWTDEGTSFTPGGGDVGSILRVVETAVNTQGSAAAVSANSAAIVASSGNAPQNSTLPKLSPAAPVVGSSVNPVQGVWTGSPAPTLVDTLQISTATSGPWTGVGSSYTPITADIGSYLRVREVATNSSGTATVFSTTSSAIAAAGSTPPVNTAIPTLSPTTVTTGTLMTASAGTWTGATGGPTYQYLMRPYEGGSISSVRAASSTATYTPLSTDGQLQVRVVETNTHGATTAHSEWAPNSNEAPYTITIEYPHPSALGPTVVPSSTVAVSLLISPNPSGVDARFDAQAFGALSDAGSTGGPNGEHRYTGSLTVDTSAPSPHNLDIAPHA